MWPIVKTKLALEHKKVKEANIILLEEPENHLSHGRLNHLIKDINLKCSEKQILISTHSSFVANKLGLDKLILLADKKTTRLNQLTEPTWEFFQKVPGYDTLRLLLCKKAILVEGDADELVVQKAYQKFHENRLPIEDEIDVISVGNTFLRFLEIADKIKIPVSVVTDNDGSVDDLKKKYEKYLGKNSKSNINICFDEEIDQGDLMIGNKKFNYNTLEPKFLKANNKKTISTILGFSVEQSEDELHKYMKRNKTECALKIFDTTEELEFPKYILSAIDEK
jgi:putative ATP-dependent endonuclease of OLD family